MRKSSFHKLTFSLILRCELRIFVMAYMEKPMFSAVLFTRSLEQTPREFIRWLNTYHAATSHVFLLSQLQGCCLCPSGFMVIRLCPQLSISNRNRGQGKLSVFLTRKQNIFPKSPSANLLNASFTRNGSNSHSQFQGSVGKRPCGCSASIM